MIALIGQPGLTVALLFVVVFLAGFGILGGQAGNNALAERTIRPICDRPVSARPLASAGSIRSSARQPQSSCGRGNSVHQLFVAFAVPALLSALAVASLRVVMKPAATAGPAAKSTAVR